MEMFYISLKRDKSSFYYEGLHWFPKSSEKKKVLIQLLLEQ